MNTVNHRTDTLMWQWSWPRSRTFPSAQRSNPSPSVIPDRHCCLFPTGRYRFLPSCISFLCLWNFHSWIHILYVFLLLFTQSYVCGTMQATATSLITLINLTNITLSNDPGTKKAYNLWHHVLYVLCRISQRLLICFAINGQLDSSRLLYTMLL